VSACSSGREPRGPRLFDLIDLFWHDR
jgi:hypothetical protein